MSIAIRIDLSGNPEILAVLDQLLLQGATKKGLFDEMGNALVAQTQLRFRDQVGPDGVAWPRSARAATQGGRTLSDKGILRQSVNTHVIAGDNISVGSNLVYAAAQQFGATIYPRHAKRLSFKVGGKRVFAKKVTLPARPFIGINAADEADISDTVIGYLDALVRRLAP